MPKKPGLPKPRSRTRSPRSSSTRKSSASTRTSRPGSRARSLTTAAKAPAKAARGAPQEALVEGISMWPALRQGYRVRFRPVPPETLETGAIVVLRGRGRRGELCYKVHRLLDRVGPFFLEAGDNAFSSSLVHPRDILGLVERAWDETGRPVKLTPPPASSPRFRFFRLCAHGFVFAHEMKDRVVGRRRSWLLWQASAAYRAGLYTLGVDVPLLQPK